jgi:ADP-ribosylation factor-like protein 8
MFMQLGSRRPATIPTDVGAILPRRQRHRVCPLGLNVGRLTNVSRFVVDAADQEALPIAKEELHALLCKPSLEGIPLLILGNKSDLRGKLSVDDLIEALDLKEITHREISCYGISAKHETNLDAVLQWLVVRSGK